ncbi:hypothetical protein [Paenibacillus wynnii]|uniref:Phage tail tape measure protein domain-containing protein n=1 Tax=Paenibacillus wynnii TaxID=268407 RepID=A0A098ME20_9BACL|nr:hypothetical protein [Paenibacillus wynnii]KGE20794.1 hypothetical protein PWYN_01030 [Paenibacillus wynnii]
MLFVVGITSLSTALKVIPALFTAIKVAAAGLGIAAGPLGLAILAVGALATGFGVLTAAKSRDKAATEAMLSAQKELNELLAKAPIDRTTADDDTIRSKAEELNAVLEERAKLQQRIAEFQSIWDRGEGTPAIMSEAMDINDELEKVDANLRSMGFDGVTAATDALGELNKALKYSVDRVTEQDKAEYEALATKKATLKEMSALATQFKELNGLQTLDASQKTRMVDITEKLIGQYPELNAHQGEDGRIRADNIDKIITQIDTDKRFTDMAATNATTRIRNFAKENEAQAKAVQAQIDNLTRLSNALAIVSGANASTFSNDIAARTADTQRKASGKVGDIVMNGALSMMATSGAKAEVDAQISEELQKQQKYNDATRELEKLASEVESGAQTFTKDIVAPDAKKDAKGKTGKTPAELAAEARKKAYEQDIKTIQYQSEFYNLTADAQIKKYDALKTKHAAFLKESVEDARTLQLQLKRLSEDSVQSRYDFSATWIDAEERRMEDAGKTELEIAQMKLDSWTRVRNRYAKDSAQYKAADDQAYRARKELAQSTVKLEQDVYRARKDAADKAADAVKDALKAETDAIKKAEKADLDAIEKRKKAALDDYDARIDAIQKLRDANKTLNTDADYATQLAEKRARLGVLASAVGPAGIAEREALLKEIDRMQLEHDRELSDRTLETQQDALKDEKAAKEKAFDTEKTLTEAKYDALLNAFEEHAGGLKTVEAGIAAFRVASAASANTAILSELDTFIAQYQTKMSALAGAQKAADQAEYAANKNAWTSARSAGNTEEMARLNARNEELRKLYGVTADSGKLQAFADGGIVKGASGAAVPAIVHGGELVLTTAMQATLFDMIAAPRVAAQSPAAPTYITNNIDMSVNDVEIADKVGMAVVYDERARAAQRLQTMGIKD